MTDSEDDVFPVDRTAIHAKGPNYSNMRTVSCRNNILTSTLHPSRNNERSNLNYAQRSLYYKRDPSPMSLRRVPDFRPRNAPSAITSTSHTGRISPTSGRGIDTNISISATDIALAIETEAFDRHGLNLIREALNKQVKKKLRNRVEKRRNRRFLLHSSKRKSGDDSGEQGSDSSISSDEYRSMRTASWVADNSKYKKRYNLAHFKMKVDDNLYKDCTKEIQRKSLKNICSDALPAKIPTQIEAKEPVHSNSEKSVILKDTSQSCLSSRDVLEEDNNSLVPADQINITNADEETCKIDNHCNKKAKIQTTTKSPSELTRTCKIVLDKLPLAKAKEQHKESPKVVLKSFWDTDTESELENHYLSHNVNDSKNSNRADQTELNITTKSLRSYSKNKKK